jgi:hypothetical protein
MGWIFYTVMTTTVSSPIILSLYRVQSSPGDVASFPSETLTESKRLKKNKMVLRM